MVIYDNTGTVLLDIEVDDTSVRYKAIKGENSLTLKFSLAEHVEVPLGAYCVFKNETYSLMLPEDFTLHHRRDFEYTLVMYSEDYSARRYKFVNPVDRRLKFSLTAKPIEHLQMFVDNMNMRDSGWEVGECPDHVEIVLSYNHTYCHDALVQLADELELDYWFNGKIVNLGKLELNKDNPLPLSYGGDGEGLKSDIKRTNYSDGLPIEVLYVQGSSTNIDPSKYRVNDKPVSELHLPLSQTIGFDGTYFEDEDGYDATKARQYKTDENGFSIRRADKEVANHSEDSLDCSEIEPTKTETVVSVIEVNTEKHFYDILFESTVDYSKYIIEGEKATVIFQSGMLAGKEFDLATDENGNLVCKQEDGKWRVEIVPQEIDGITMPDSESGYMPVANDTFKVFGIQLPQEYISDNDTKSGAEWDMFRYAVKHLYANEDVQYTISGTLDEIYAKRNWDSIKDRITLGSYISFTDKSFQEEALLIRITGIKEHVNKPYSPILEISNAALSGTLIGTLNRIENQEVQTEDMFRNAIGFSKRRWRDAKETISLLQGALTNFSDGINPITVETMSMLVGDERLQFVFTESLTSDVYADLLYAYDTTTGTFSVQSAFIKHMTLGIDSISPVHTDDEYKRWSVSEVSQILDEEVGYYLYAKVSKDSTIGAFELSDKVLDDTDEWYYLLVGILNSEYDGERSFASMYGYTEVRPGQITTDNIRSSDGKTWLDLLKGILHLNDNAGVSGAIDAEKGDKSIAAWFGGLMEDIELDASPSNPANTLFRHDGSGYLAQGNIKFNEKGEVELSPNIKISGTGNETLDSILTMLAVLNDMFYFADENTIGTKYNFFSEQENSAGGVGESIGTSGGEGGGSVDLTGYATQEWVQDQGYALDSDLSNLEDRVTSLEATGGGTGGEIDLSAYATKTWVEEKGYVTTSEIPTKVSQLTNDRNYITTTAADGKYAAYSDLNEYLKTADIADWAKEASKPSYTYDEIGGTPDLSIYALASDLANYLTTATASETYVSKTSLTDTLASYLLKTDIADWAKASTKPTYKYSEIEDSPDLSVYALASALADYALKTDVYTKTEVANLLKSYVTQSDFTEFKDNVDGRVAALEEWYDSVGRLFTLDSTGAVKMEGDFFTTGENSAGNVGESTDNTGGLDEEALGDYLEENGYATQSWVASQSYATESALARKQDVIQDLATIRANASLGATALQSIPSEYVTDDDLTDGLSAKVDKVAGKGLSTNDYTTYEKNKLAALENYDDTELVERIGAVEGAIGTNLADIASLKTKVSTAEENITSNKNGITDLDSRMDILEEWYNAVGQYFSKDDDDTIKVGKNFYSIGENSAGGPSTTVGGEAASVNNLAINFATLANLADVGSTSDAALASIGLTSEAIENLLDAQYNKIVNSGTARSVWDYTAFENGGDIYIQFRQGDGFDIMNGYSLIRSSSTGAWSIVLGEI